MNKTIRLYYGAVFVFLVAGCSISITVTGQSCNSYETVKIGNQVWMVKNLNVNKFLNGDSIPHAKTNEEWKKAGEEGRPAWCYYNNDPANGLKYGKIYNWYAVNDPRGLAPYGWRIPSDEEWNTLVEYLGGEKVAGIKMKAISEWEGEGNQTNSSGFSGLPGGYRSSNGYFGSIGFYANWWSSTESNPYDAKAYYLGYTNDVVYNYLGYKRLGLSVRCLRD